MIFVDHRSEWLSPVRFGLNILAAPVQYVADIPKNIVNWSENSVRSRASLEEENLRLQSEVLVLKRRVQKLASTVAENTRLKELMNASDMVDDQVLIAEIIGVDPDPYRHEVVVNKGSRHQVYAGQAVLDAEGLMGQVIEAGPLTSRVLLVSDITHGIPVHLNRNGVRAIAVGTGSLDRLTLIHVPDTADIALGDLLVSSGLGGRFPKGYPVGIVTLVEHDPGQPFAIVEAKPMANLDRSRHVLLVFSDEGRDNPTAETPGSDASRDQQPEPVEERLDVEADANASPQASEVVEEDRNG